jgi:hypothetical protein
MNIKDILLKLIKSWNNEYLDFKLVKSQVDVSTIMNEESFVQECIEIIPTHKQITELPKDCHEDWTLETYQTDLINQIDLNIFHCYCLWSEFGLIVISKNKETELMFTYDFLKELNINIELSSEVL